MFIDLHTHTFFSDGELIPSELVCRAANNGYKAIALTDHVDFSNMDFVIPRLKKVVKSLSVYHRIEVIAGCEITYVPPPDIRKAVLKARRLGAEIVVIHGETPVEPVPRGTNRAGILSGADIIAHPGYILEEDVMLAARRKVCLEITTRCGHNRGNAHVSRLALKNKSASLVLDTDTHSPEDMITPDRKLVKETLGKSGLSERYYNDVMLKNSLALIKKIRRK